MSRSIIDIDAAFVIAIVLILWWPGASDAERLSRQLLFAQLDLVAAHHDALEARAARGGR